ncbi:cyclin-like protein [Spinellus fusiger]|nr:cyclin-like protein [Spinellus fusiger]
MYSEAQRLNQRRSAPTVADTNENASVAVPIKTSNATSRGLGKLATLNSNTRQRNALSDKSNIKPYKTDTKLGEKIKEKEKDTEKEKTKDNEKKTTERPTEQPTQEKKNETTTETTQQEVAAEISTQVVKEVSTEVVNVKEPQTVKQDTIEPPLDEDIQDFFNDNAERYKNRDKLNIEPVPVIKIPALTRMKKEIRHQSRKRSGENLTEAASKKTKSIIENTSKDADDFFSPDSDTAREIHIDSSVSEATTIYEEQQELRSKEAALRTDKPLRYVAWNDPMLVSEYAENIFQVLKESEKETMPNPMYITSQQHEVTWRMRGVLIDWIVEIHYLFQLLPETLFLTVNLVDRFLSSRTVVQGKLQLVGITTLYIATKFEEINTPAMQDFLFMTDRSIKEDDLLKAERFILQVLDFKLCYSNPLGFMRRTSMGGKYDVHTRMLAKYFMEVSCVDHRFMSIKPSLVAASSLWLSQKMLSKGVWTAEMSYLAGYQVSDIRPIVELILDYLSQPVRHDAFFRKWSSKRLMKASIFARDWIQRYYLA